MSDFNINGYSTDSQKVYDVMQKYSSVSDQALAKLDKNGDKKITEDELVEILDIQEDDDVTKADKASDKKTSNDGESDGDSEVSAATKKALKQLTYYEEQNVRLEQKLTDLVADLGKAKDVSALSSVMSQIEQIQTQIDSNCNQIYQILVNKELQEEAEAEQKAAQSAASSTNAGSSIPSAASVSNVDSVDTSKLTTGKGISGGSDFGNSIVSIASSFAGKLKETDGSYLKVTGGRQEAWCADFVTYCVKEACKQTGTNLNGFGSPSVANLKAWGMANNCYSDLNKMSAAQKAEWIKSNVKPGDVMIQQNGVSHTGIVTKVYPDGSYDTIEGNTSDQCLPRHYSAADAKLSGFIKIT